MSTSGGPKNVEITSCALGGHLLGRGSAVKDQLAEKYPDAAVTHKMGLPLQFSIKADDNQVMGGMAGTCTILQLLTCCTSPSAVAGKVTAGTPERGTEPLTVAG